MHHELCTFCVVIPFLVFLFSVFRSFFTLVSF